MRKFKILSVLVLCVFLVACASLISNSYKSLAISKVTYDTALKAAADFQSKGLITQDQRDQINKAAKLFKAAHNVAVDALEVYATTDLASDKAKLFTALATAASKWEDVAKLINTIKPNTVPAKFGQ